jgi:hypothetical protein
MPWNANFEPDSQILEVIFCGVCTMEELIGAVMYSLDFSNQTGTMRFLVDLKDFQSNDAAPILNAYNLGKLYEDLNVSKSIREAIVAPPDPEIWTALKFFEITAQNRYYQVRVFADGQEARAWLMD